MNRESADPPVSGLDPELWLERHGDALYRYARLRVRDTALAEDLVQETLLAALKARERFAGRAAERTWLIAILKNKLVDQLRKQAREQPHEDPDELIEAQFLADGHWRSPPADWANPTAAFENREFWRVLAECLEALPERQARAFALCEFDDVEGGEASKILGVTPTNLWVLLHRARLRLRRCLEMNWFQPVTEPKR
jgi:RNA polymerase sigma-70 factor (ECF subfamily)